MCIGNVIGILLRFWLFVLFGEWVGVGIMGLPFIGIRLGNYIVIGTVVIRDILCFGWSRFSLRLGSLVGSRALLRISIICIGLGVSFLFLSLFVLGTE